VTEPSAPPGAEPKADIRCFADVIRLADEHREALLSTHLRNNVHFVRLEPGSLEFRPDANAPRDLAQQISRHLETWTGSRWMVAVSSDEGEATVADQERQEDDKRRHEAEIDPMVAEVLETFPGAKVVGVHDRETMHETQAD
jgi:DNA polymerase-3 subunit gamma/tau